MLPFTNLELREQIDLGYVKETKHPEFDLWIYNYTNHTQYDAAWNKVTNNCRGLILDKDMNIVARPFPKFHNYSEHVGQGKPLPERPITVTEKMDGSLGILYWWKDKPYIATRGSFTSEQAIKGTEILRDWYWENGLLMDHPYTFLFEILYPQNRIVIDYGNEEKLVLLAVINKETGEELPLPDWYPHVVPHHDFNSIEDVLAAKQEDNREGFVVRFNNGLRLKIKFDEYVRLHRLLTQTSARDIWDLLKNNSQLDELLNLVPDEFYGWVQSVVGRLEQQYDDINKQVNRDWANRPNTTDRKTMALYFQTCKYPSLLFLLLDGKYDRLREATWKMLRPEHEIPFRVET